MKQAHFSKLENMYLAGRCNELYQPTILVEKGQATISFAIQESFFHAAGAVHGSVYFKALDDAAYFASNSLEPRFFMVTSSFTTYFLRPVTQGQLKAVGKVVSRSKSQMIAEAIVYDDRGKEVARGSGTFMRSATELSEEIGYC